MSKAREWGPLSPRMCRGKQPLFDDPPRLPFETAAGRAAAKADMLGEMARGYAFGTVRLEDLCEQAVEYAKAKEETRR